MTSPSKRVGVDGEIVHDHANRIDAATVADAPALVMSYNPGSKEPATAGYRGKLDATLAQLAANAKALNTTVANHTAALRDAVRTLNAADDHAASETSAIQALLDQQPAKKPVPAPAGGAPKPAPSTLPSGESAADVFRKAAGGQTG